MYTTSSGKKRDKQVVFLKKVKNTTKYNKVISQRLARTQRHSDRTTEPKKKKVRKRAPVRVPKREGKRTKGRAIAEERLDCRPEIKIKINANSDHFRAMKTIPQIQN